MNLQRWPCPVACHARKVSSYKIACVDPIGLLVPYAQKPYVLVPRQYSAFLLFVFRAVDLAEKHDFPQIEALIARHTSQLLQKGDPLQAVEVYRMAGKATDAALLLAKLAEDAGERADVTAVCVFKKAAMR